MKTAHITPHKNIDGVRRESEKASEFARC